MDKIFIQELKVETIIGCLAWERQVKQQLIIDLEIEHDHKAAGLSDDLKDTLDYSSIASAVTDYITTSEFKLLEALAEKTIQMLLQEFNLESIMLKVTKPGAIPNARAVSISMQRSATPSQ